MENKQVYDAAGKAVTLTQTGSYLANVGKMTIAEDGAITTELISTADVSDAAVAATAEAWINDVDAMLGEQIATTDIKFYINDPATGKRRIRTGETNLGDFVADGIYTYFNEIEQLDCDIAMMNGGGIRTDVDAGKWTFKTCKQVSPFGNVACLMSVTGKQIQDALEFGARFVGPEARRTAASCMLPVRPTRSTPTSPTPSSPTTRMSGWAAPPARPASRTCASTTRRPALTSRWT